MPTETTTLPTGAITVGTRIRKKPGCLIKLSASMEKLGMLHPIVVNSRHELIAGFRRLTVAKMKAWETVPVRVVETLDDAVLALIAERDENDTRADLTIDEMLEVGRLLESLVAPEAVKRRREGNARGGANSNKKREPEGAAIADTRPNATPATESDSRTQDVYERPPPMHTNNIVGAALGIGGTTRSKMKAVDTAARDDPEKYGDVLQQMRDTGNIDSAYKELRLRKKGGDPTPKKPRSAHSKAVRDLAGRMWAGRVKASGGDIIRPTVEDWELLRSIVGADGA